MTYSIASTSREAVIVTHYTDTDPTENAVWFAFLPTATPAPAIDDAAWVAGEWDGAAAPGAGEHAGSYVADARVVVGPGSDVGALAAGRWRVWTWVDGSTTDPVKRSGDLIVF